MIIAILVTRLSRLIAKSKLETLPLFVITTMTSDHAIDTCGESLEKGIVIAVASSNTGDQMVAFYVTNTKNKKVYLV